MRMPIKIGDLVVYFFAAALIIVGLLGVYVMGTESGNKNVVIEVNGKEVYSCRLYKGMAPVEFRVDAGNDQYNIVLITYEEVKIKEANCPDQICVKSGSIAYAGQALVCLPHKVVVKITAVGGEIPGVDDIAS